jgi:hypothetical protein
MNLIAKISSLLLTANLVLAVVLEHLQAHVADTQLGGVVGSDQGSQRVMAVVEDRSLEDQHDLAQLEIGALMDTASVGVATYEASRGWLQTRPARGGAGAPAGGASGTTS